MKKVNVIVEISEDGFSSYSDQIPGCVSVGNSLDELRINMQEAISFHIEGLKEFNEEIPSVLLSDYMLEFRLDVKQLFEFLNELDVTAFAKKIRFNGSLLRQYSSGTKSPSEKQSIRILHGLRTYGQTLASL